MESARANQSLFDTAEWYDQSINWKARLNREIPVLRSVFGKPPGRLLDAGCGTAHQACALSALGYDVVAADASEPMLRLGRQHAERDGVGVRFVEARYDELVAKAGAGFDGVFCQGNALAAAGSLVAVSDAMQQFAGCLCAGGKLFLQVLNFEPMKKEQPCVRGPRIAEHGGVEYISTRQFFFEQNSCRVTNITLWKDNGWKQRANVGELYPVSVVELKSMCDELGLKVLHLWGDYTQAPFDINSSVDMILVARYEPD